jgi:TolB-like protein
MGVTNETDRRDRAGMSFAIHSFGSGNCRIGIQGDRWGALAVASGAVCVAHLLLVSLTAFAQTAKKPAQLPTLIVFDIAPEKGVERNESNLLTELVIDRVTRLKRHNVMGQKDLDKMFNWEQNKQLKGCSDTSCLVQIAGAMGAAYYIEGSVGIMGAQYIITLKLMDANNVKIVERATEQVKKDEDVVVAEIKRMVDAIMGIKGAPVETPGSVYEPWGMAGTFGGAAILLVGGVFSAVQKQSVDGYQSAKDPNALKDARDKAGLYGNVALGCYIAGGAIAATGAVLWIYSSTVSTGKVALVPSAGPGSAALVLLGGW